MKRFQLVRDVDVSGVSGTGVVAEGVVWDNNKATVHWFGARQSIVQWDTIDDAVAIHGHGGATRFVWIDEDPHTRLTWEEMRGFVVKLSAMAAYLVGMFRGFYSNNPTPLTLSSISEFLDEVRKEINEMDQVIAEIMAIEKSRGR